MHRGRRRWPNPIRKDLLERFRFGRVCATLNPASIQSSLAAMIQDDDWRLRARKACEEAYDAELSATVFRSRFAELLDVPEDDLLC